MAAALCFRVQRCRKRAPLLASLRRTTPRTPNRIARKWLCVRENCGRLSAGGREHHMPSHAASEIRLTRTRIAAAPISDLVSYSKEAQKVTPWKNYLAETKPLIGIFARPPVTPWRSQSEPSFCFTRRARANGLAEARRAFPPRPNRTFLLCTNRTFSLCPDWPARFACHQRAAEGTITGAGPARYFFLASGWAHGTGGLWTGCSLGKSAENRR